MEGRSNSCDAGVPTLCSDQWDELNLAKILVIELVLAGPGHSNQTLQSRGLAYRNDEPAANRQLLEQRLGHLRTAGCHDDHVVGSMLGPAKSAVAMKNLDFRVPLTLQTSRCQLGQLLVPLDGIDLANHFREHRCRVSGAGPYLQGAAAGARLDALDHEGDDIGLRNGLVGLDRQRRILVRELGEFVGEKSLARDTSHRFEHRWIAHSARGNLIADHPKTLAS